MVLAFISVYPFASILVGVGLASRSQSMSVYRLACYGLVVVGALALINFLAMQHVSSAEPLTMLTINNTLLLIGALCLFGIGVGMYRGRSELTA